MADIQQQDRGHGKHLTLRQKNIQIHIDMTPMVDLAFLLLTFFMLTTSFMKVRKLDITVPFKGPPTPVPANQTLSILMTSDNSIMWYEGEDDPSKQPKIHSADFSSGGPNSIHRILLNKNKLVLDKIEAMKDSVMNGLIRNDKEEIRKHITSIKESDKQGLMVLIKTCDQSKYKNLVSILDEIMLCHVARYAIGDVSSNEEAMIKNAR
jgi:biopolymer transport protein ExbD